MIFQWYVFLIIGLVWVISKAKNLFEEVSFAGTVQIKQKRVIVFLLAVPLILLAGFRGTMDGFGDSLFYINEYLSVGRNYSGIPDIIKAQGVKDKGFVLFEYLFHKVFGDNYTLLFLVIAVVCIICVLFTFRKYSVSFFISAFLFVASGDYIQWCYNGTRQFIAAAIIFACMGLLLRKKFVTYILIVLLASTIHFAALLVIPVILIVRGRAFNLRSFLFIVAVLVTICFVDVFTSVFTDFMENSQYKKQVVQFENSSGTNILRVIVYSVPLLLAFFQKKKVTELNNNVINLCVGMSIVTTGLYIISAVTSGLYIGRMTIYFSLFNYLLLPWEIKYLFNEKTSRHVMLWMVLLYLGFYVYQVSAVWKL